MKAVLKWLFIAVAGVLLLAIFAIASMAGKLSMVVVGVGLWLYERHRSARNGDDS